MIITDMNKMNLEELGAMHSHMGLRYEINDGKIVGSVQEKSTDTDSESDQC